MNTEQQTPLATNCDAPPALAPAPGSVMRFRRRVDTDELCSAEYRGHMIDCAAHWRRKGQWNVSVRTKAGELVADMTYHGYDRRAMLEAAAKHAGLTSQNTEASERGQKPN